MPSTGARLTPRSRNSRWPATPDNRPNGGNAAGSREGTGSAERRPSSAPKRHAARALVVQALYAAELKGQNAHASEELDKLLEIDTVDKEVESYARKLLRAVESGDSADRLIQSVLSSWTLDRVTPVERCILWVGLAELEGTLGVPPIVAIDEAIRLAKEFGTKNSEKFVNGVLDAIYKKKKPAP